MVTASMIYPQEAYLTDLFDCNFGMPIYAIMQYIPSKLWKNCAVKHFLRIATVSHKLLYGYILILLA